MDELLSQLKSEPALAWKVAVLFGDGQPDAAAVKQAARVTRQSPLVTALLAGWDQTGHAYRKWNGSHWILSVLADLGCPSGDESLRPLMEETFNCWLSEDHIKKHLRVLEGRVRRCASQEGNAVWCSLRLGFADGRTDEMVNRLLKWQWPDGGWNCDKHPEADTSSFMETLIPLRALALYVRLSGDAKVKQAAERAAEVFLSRELFKRRRDGQVIDPHFLLLHYPAYWHYDILFALKVMAEAGFIADPRCKEALDLLESRRLPDGGFPADESFARTTRPELSGYSPVGWGRKNPKHMNPFVTADALYVLRVSGRPH